MSSQHPWTSTTIAYRAPRSEKRTLVPQMREMYEAGYSCPEIARRLGVAIPNVQRWLAAAGVKLRTRNEGKYLAKVRNTRRRLIAAAAQRVFGHLFAPRAEVVAHPPVQDDFDGGEVPTLDPGEIGNAWGWP